MQCNKKKHAIFKVREKNGRHRQMPPCSQLKPVIVMWSKERCSQPGLKSKYCFCSKKVAIFKNAPFRFLFFLLAWSCSKILKVHVFCKLRYFFPLSKLKSDVLVFACTRRVRVWRCRVRSEFEFWSLLGLTSKKYFSSQILFTQSRVLFTQNLLGLGIDCLDSRVCWVHEKVPRVRV